jgi:deoxyribose-phosphate aldolase
MQPNTAPMPAWEPQAQAARRTLTPGAVAAMIDESLLIGRFTPDQVWDDCRLAVDLAMACVYCRPKQVRLARDAVAGSRVRIGTVLDFPDGTATTAAKVAEAHHVTKLGANEVAVVVNSDHVRAKRGNLAAELIAIAAVTDEAHAMLKVVLHTGELTPPEIATACRISEGAGAQIIAGGSWFASGLSSVNELTLLRRSVGRHVTVKPVGRVRGLDMLLSLYAAGVNRFNAVNPGKLVAEARERAASGGIVVPTPQVSTQYLGNSGPVSQDRSRGLTGQRDRARSTTHHTISDRPTPPAIPAHHSNGMRTP